jgi:hypothetical protein
MLRKIKPLVSVVRMPERDQKVMVPKAKCNFAQLPIPSDRHGLRCIARVSHCIFPKTNGASPHRRISQGTRYENLSPKKHSDIAKGLTRPGLKCRKLGSSQAAPPQQAGESLTVTIEKAPKRNTHVMRELNHHIPAHRSKTRQK